MGNWHLLTHHAVECFYLNLNYIYSSVLGIYYNAPTQEHYFNAIKIKCWESYSCFVLLRIFTKVRTLISWLAKLTSHITSCTEVSKILCLSYCNHNVDVLKIFAYKNVQNPQFMEKTHSCCPIFRALSIPFLPQKFVSFHLYSIKSTISQGKFSYSS